MAGISNNIVRLFALVIGVFSSVALFSQRMERVPFLSDTMSVFAPGGVVLREAPDSKSEKIKTIPFGRQVYRVTSEYYVRNFETHDIIPGKLRVHEGWLKVSDQTDTGYLWTGFLSSFRAVPKGFINTVDENESLLESYLTKVMGIEKQVINLDSINKLTSYCCDTCWNMAFACPKGFKVYYGNVFEKIQDTGMAHCHKLLVNVFPALPYAVINIEERDLWLLALAFATQARGYSYDNRRFTFSNKKKTFTIGIHQYDDLIRSWSENCE